jgi:hypothetical protein
MAEEELFEGLLATLTTEQGKKDLVSEEIERREGVRVNSVEGTSTGYLVIGEPAPGGGGGTSASGGEWWVVEVDEEFLERIKGPIRNLATNKSGVFSDIIANRGLAPGLAAADGLVHAKGELLNDISCGEPAPELTKYEIRLGGMKASSLFVARLSALCGAAGGTGIPVISGFRPLGMDVTTGMKDPDGIFDSRDDYGHWSGDAADLKTRYWRLALGHSNLNDKGQKVADDKYTSFNELDYLADEQGLYRPFKHPDFDPTHWTIVEQTKWYRKPDPSKKYTAGWSNSTWDRRCPKKKR